MRLTEPSGRIRHAEIDFGWTTLMVSDEFPECGITGPREGCGTPGRQGFAPIRNEPEASLARKLVATPCENAPEFERFRLWPLYDGSMKFFASGAVLAFLCLSVPAVAQAPALSVKDVFALVHEQPASFERIWEQRFEAAAKDARGGRAARSPRTRLHRLCLFPLARNGSSPGELGVNPARVVIAGFSSGGTVAALLTTTSAAGDVRGAVLMSPCVAPLGDGWFRRMTEGRVSESEVTPAANLGAADPATFAVHGEADEMCPYSDTTAFVTAARDAGVDVELLTLPGATHFFAFRSPDARARAAEAIERFLERRR